MLYAISLTEINCVFAGLTLLVSVGILIVQHRNQTERRHGEIVTLKEKILADLDNQRQRVNAFLTNCEIVRLELRRLPDCDSKYALIEKVPKLIELTLENEKGINENIEALQKMDSQAFNRTDVLLNLQSMTSLTSKSKGLQNEAEAAMLSLLKGVQEINIG